MPPLEIAVTKCTPHIFFDSERHLLTIEGDSYPENSQSFYTPVFAWLRDYLAQLSPTQTVTVNMEIVYFNSSSSKSLMAFFEILESAALDGKTIVIQWIYDQDNDSALEYGAEFQEDLSAVQFHLIQKET